MFSKLPYQDLKKAHTETVIGVTDEDYDKMQKFNTVEEYKTRLAQVEKLIMPFLTNLLKTADKPYINWPNRKPILEAQIQKILTLTRG